MYSHNDEPSTFQILVMAAVTSVIVFAILWLAMALF